ncbi:MAG: biotin--[Clostridia bacterium]|nr:biotin--[acetyl-CoA-carboxylase] ligase [Clostridia bacterium]
MELYAEKIREMLRGDARKFSLRVLPVAASTNTLAREAGAAGAEAGLVILAGEQTAGRGRLGRSFFSPEGTGLYMSLLLRPHLPPEKVIRITTAAAVAVCRAVEKLTGERPGIKWVNDIFLRGRKVCGILTEAAFDGRAGLRYAVLGIGINVMPPRGGFPPEIADIAGSIFDAYAPGLRERCAAEVLSCLAEVLPGLAVGGHAEEYRDRSLVLQRRVKILGGSGGEGVVTDIDSECRLHIRRDDGREEILSTGEISIRMEETEGNSR